jgi:hypothetical protein
MINKYSMIGKPATLETINPSNLVFDSSYNFCYSLQNVYNHLEMGCYHTKDTSDGIGASGNSLKFAQHFSSGMNWGKAHSMILMPSEKAAIVGGLL